MSTVYIAYYTENENASKKVNEYQMREIMAEHVPIMPHSRHRGKNVEIGQRLELLRRALGYHNISEFTRAISKLSPNRVSPQSWCNYLSGHTRFPTALAAILRREWAVTYDWIYEGDSYGLPHGLAQRIEEVAAIDDREVADRFNDDGATGI